MPVQQKTKVMMDSGIVYALDMNPEAFMAKITCADGVLRREFVQFGNVWIHPTHISSIELVEDQA